MRGIGAGTDLGYPEVRIPIGAWPLVAGFATVAPVRQIGRRRLIGVLIGALAVLVVGVALFAVFWAGNGAESTIGSQENPVPAGSPVDVYEGAWKIAVVDATSDATEDVHALRIAGRLQVEIEEYGLATLLIRRFDPDDAEGGMVSGNTCFEIESADADSLVLFWQEESDERVFLPLP